MKTLIVPAFDTSEFTNSVDCALITYTPQFNKLIEKTKTFLKQFENDENFDCIRFKVNNVKWALCDILEEHDVNNLTIIDIKRDEVKIKSDTFVLFRLKGFSILTCNYETMEEIYTEEIPY